MSQKILVVGCFLVLFTAGCGSKPAGNVATDVDATAIEQYQAETEGDNYKDYVEPK